MSDFPDDEMEFAVVDHLFDNYDICFAKGDTHALIYCIECGDVVTEIEREKIAMYDDMDLYERIIDEHPPIESFK